MKTIIAGSRGINDIGYVRAVIPKTGWNITEVVSGGAKGVDTCGEEWARENDIPWRVFPAEWDRFGKGAGYIRNSEMADYADALIAIWDGKSRGTKNMIESAKRKGLKVYVYKI